jgi:hypothetical protein
VKRYVMTEEDRRKGIEMRREKGAARRMRREAEMALLNRLYAELAMPEWYPHQ